MLALICIDPLSLDITEVSQSNYDILEGTVNDLGNTRCRELSLDLEELILDNAVENFLLAEDLLIECDLLIEFSCFVEDLDLFDAADAEGVGTIVVSA